MIQKTLILIKPDGVLRNLIGDIISRYEKAGLKVLNLRLLDAPPEVVEKHYPMDEDYLRSIGEKSVKAGEEVSDTVEQGRKVVTWLRNFITSGPIVAMVLEGEEAIPQARKVTGYTDPSTAEAGSIRGDFGTDSILEANRDGRPVYNLIHASGNPEEAEFEISIWEKVFK